jgi:hypothetical protein
MLSIARPRSRLRFAIASPTTEATKLTRVRKAVSRSKAGVQAKVAHIAAEKSLHAESLNELAAFRVIIACSHADFCQEQPCVLEYRFAEKSHRYTPDVLLAWGTHFELAEIKDDAEAALPENQERFAAIKEALAEHGYAFRVWRRSEIIAEPRMSNVTLVLRYRTVEPSDLERERIRRAIQMDSNSSLTIGSLGEVSGISLQSILSLVLDGTLNINWWERLTLTSRIGGSPIGQQVWPCPAIDNTWECPIDLCCYSGESR